MSENYSGPITIVTFVSVVNPEDKFGLTLHVNHDDEESIKKIAARYAEDGYKPDLKSVRKWYMLNGEIQEREPRLHAIGYRVRSAFLRA